MRWRARTKRCPKYNRAFAMFTASIAFSQPFMTPERGGVGSKATRCYYTQVYILISFLWNLTRLVRALFVPALQPEQDGPDDRDQDVRVEDHPSIARREVAGRGHVMDMHPRRSEQEQ